jgi:putative ABC transport system permease protein
MLFGITRVKSRCIMIRHYILILIRNVEKHAFFIGFNVLGMAIAIAFCVLAFFNYSADINYDSNHRNGSSIYRVNSIRKFEGTETPFAIVPAPLGAMVKQNIKEVDHLTRYSLSRSFFKVNDDIFPAGLAYTDPEFFSMFTFAFLEGNPSAFHKKENVLLTDEMAKKLFGTAKVVGKSLTLLVGETKRELIVGAVIRRPPEFSSFLSAAYLNYENYREEFPNEKEDDWQYRNTLFLQINNQKSVPVILDKLQSYMDNNIKVRSDFQIKSYILDPFTNMARHDSAQKTQQIMTRPAGPRSAVLGNIISALLILLLACLNLTNTSVAVSSTRLKEIGIRKAMGSEKKHLVAQFLGETFVIVILSLFIGLQIAEFFLDGWNAMWPWVKLEIHYLDQPYFLVSISFLVLIVSLLAGGYPAFYISRFQAVSVLKGKIKFGGTNYFTRFLLVLQFCIAVMGIVFAVAFVENARYQRDYDLGFNQSGVIFTRVGNYADYKNYRDVMERNKDITAVAGSKHHLLYSIHPHQPIKYESSQLEVDLLEVGDSYRKTMGFTLRQGRDFIEDSQTDRAESVLVTESLAKEFKWDSPIGKEILFHDTVKLFVVGVLKDVYTNGLWTKMEPMILRPAPEKSYAFFLVSAPLAKIEGVKKSMEKEWKKLFPDRLFSAQTMDETMNQTITVNNNLVMMFTFFGMVSILLSSTGLFALVSLNIVKRMKEIGVRKVLGATISQITMMINQEFFVILTLSFIGGCIASYYLANGLMGAIWEYYRTTSLLTFGVAGLALLAIAGSTIVIKVYQAARVNPVETLKDE